MTAQSDAMSAWIPLERNKTTATSWVVHIGLFMKVLGIVVAIAATVSASYANAGGWFSGQTGQYHLIPSVVDEQKLTLVAGSNSGCPNDGQMLFAVDEFGHKETVPFVVPSQTVFVLTDAIFTGNTQLALQGNTPVLNIGVATAQTLYTASFLASRPLVGNALEAFIGQGSLVSGAAFPVNSKLCAAISLAPGNYGYAPLALNNVVVHGTLETDYRTNAPPYFTW
jgi:hypothetical protein